MITKIIIKFSRTTIIGIAIISSLLMPTCSTAMMRTKRAAVPQAKTAVTPFLLGKAKKPEKTASNTNVGIGRSAAAPIQLAVNTSEKPERLIMQDEQPSPTIAAQLHEQQIRLLSEKLWWATKAGNLDTITSLLKLGADPNYDIGNSSALFLACAQRNEATLKLFAQYAQPDIIAAIGLESPLSEALNCNSGPNSPAFLDLLIQSHHEKDESFYKELEDTLRPIIKNSDLASLQVILKHTNSSTALKAYVYAHGFKQPVIVEAIADNYDTGELKSWYAIFSQHHPHHKELYPQAKRHLYTVIRERLARQAAKQAELSGFEREFRDNAHNHTQHDNRLACIEELRRHAQATAHSANLAREVRENALNHHEHDSRIELETALRSKAFFVAHTSSLQLAERENKLSLVEKHAAIGQELGLECEGDEGEDDQGEDEGETADSGSDDDEWEFVN